MVLVRTLSKSSIRIVGVEDWRFLIDDMDGVVGELELGWASGRGKYFLDMAELTYLIYKDLCDVYIENNKSDLASLYSHFPQMDYAWSKFTVLLDLRERGRRAKSGYSPRELLYTKGGEKVLVFVLEENTLIEASKIVDWVRSAIMREFMPVIAIVDAHGDVTYYSASISRARELSRVYLNEGLSGDSQGN